MGRWMGRERRMLMGRMSERSIEAGSLLYDYDVLHDIMMSVQKGMVMTKAYD